MRRMGWALRQRAPLGGNFKHGPAGAAGLAQPPGSPAAAEADKQARICKAAI